MREFGPDLRYAAASLCLGLIAVWGSENLFWTAPAAPWHPAEWLMTWLAYSLVSAAALSAVLWAGLGGWRGVFLGGAILGFGVEGVVVATMYDAFPAQIVWTPLAWHALITALGVLALHRLLVRASLALHVAGMVALGLFGAVWGLYWPTERASLPGYGVALAYLPGLALTVVAAQIGLDRIGTLTAPRPAVLAVAPALLGVMWLLRLAFGPAPVLLACPVMIGLTVWVMRRLGRTGEPLRFGAGVPAWRHGMFLLAPVLTAGLVVAGWRAFGAVAVNIPVALLSGATGLAIWIWLLWKALRAPQG